MVYPVTVLLIVWAAVGFGLSQKPAQSHVLDLTTPAVVVSAGPAAGINSGHSGQMARPFPMELLLRSLDRPEYRLGEEIVYEVTLRNISGRQILLPWSVDLEPVYAAGTPPLRAGLALQITDDAKGASADDPRLAVVSLGGSPGLPGSILPLEPGDTAVIRAKGPTTLREDVTRRVTAGAVRVMAIYTLYTEDGTRWEPLSSRNSVAASFRLGGRASQRE
jgi:hypothetical protein